MEDEQKLLKKIVQLKSICSNKIGIGKHTKLENKKNRSKLKWN